MSGKAISCALLHQQVMSPSTVLRHRRHQQQRGGCDSDVDDLERGSEVPLLPGGAQDQRGRMQALEDGRVVEDRLIGQEVSMATPRNSQERLSWMNSAVARTAEGGQGARAGGPLDGVDVPVPLTPLVTASRGNHPDVERGRRTEKLRTTLQPAAAASDGVDAGPGARALYPNVLPGPSPPRTPMPLRSDPMRRPDFLRAEEVKRQKETGLATERGGASSASRSSRRK